MHADVEDFGRQLIDFLPRLRRFAISLTRSHDRADDLVQSACERALANRARFEPGTRFDAWMFRIARNLWIDRIRRERTAGPTEDIDERLDIADATEDQVAEARMALRSVSEAIDELPEEQRQVLILTCVEDLPYREAAEVLGVPIGTVMSRLARARKKLAAATGITGDAQRSSGNEETR